MARLLIARSESAEGFWGAPPIHRGGRLEARRTYLVSGEALYREGGERTSELLSLAICSRLSGDDWYGDAAMAILNSVEDLPSFVGALIDPDTGFDYGLNGLMIARGAQHVCWALDFLEDVPGELRDRCVERVLVPVADRLNDEIPRGGSNWQAPSNSPLNSRLDSVIRIVLPTMVPLKT